MLYIHFHLEQHPQVRVPKFNPCQMLLVSGSDSRWVCGLHAVSLQEPYNKKHMSDAFHCCLPCQAFRTCSTSKVLDLPFGSFFFQAPGHLRKLFQEAYAPSPFSFAVRRSSQHSPEGAISVEESQTAMQSPAIGLQENLWGCLKNSENRENMGELPLFSMVYHHCYGIFPWRTSYLRYTVPWYSPIFRYAHVGVGWHLPWHLRSKIWGLTGRPHHSYPSMVILGLPKTRIHFMMCWCFKDRFIYGPSVRSHQLLRFLHWKYLSSFLPIV